MARARTIEVFGTSLLDTISCGLGAVILLMFVFASMVEAGGDVENPPSSVVVSEAGEETPLQRFMLLVDVLRVGEVKKGDRFSLVVSTPKGLPQEDRAILDFDPSRDGFDGPEDRLDDQPGSEIQAFQVYTFEGTPRVLDRTPVHSRHIARVGLVPRPRNPLELAIVRRARSAGFPVQIQGDPSPAEVAGMRCRVRLVTDTTVIETDRCPGRHRVQVVMVGNTFVLRVDGVALTGAR